MDKKIMMSNKILNEVVEKLKGKKLNTENINIALKEIGFNKCPDVSIIAGYKVDENSFWVELTSCNSRVRCTVTNDENIVL